MNERGEPNRCCQCGEEPYRCTGPDGQDGAGFCAECERLYPAALLKSTVDPFDYALKLTTGELICFHEAAICGDWVHLTEPTHNRFADKNPLVRVPTFDRGVDVRLDAIVWCADAPFGS